MALGGPHRYERLRSPVVLLPGDSPGRGDGDTGQDAARDGIHQSRESRRSPCEDSPTSFAHDPDPVNLCR